MRHPTRRFSGPSTPYHAQSVANHYRHVYYAVTDMAVQQISARWEETPGSGLTTSCSLETMPMTGDISDQANLFPDLNISSLKIQLRMFVQNYKPTSADSARNSLLTMSPETRRLFCQVQQLVQLLLVIPALPCEAECSFSALRRLKTWLRNTMGQVRLNSAAICNVHKE